MRTRVQREAAKRVEEEKAKILARQRDHRGERRGDETSSEESPTHPVIVPDRLWNEGRFRKITLVSFGRRLHDHGWQPHEDGYLLNAEFRERLFEDDFNCTGMSVVALERLVEIKGFECLLKAFARNLKRHPVKEDVTFNIRCQWGKHRSVACRYALALGVKAMGWKHIDTYDYEREDRRWKRTLAGIVLNNTCFNTIVSNSCSNKYS